MSSLNIFAIERPHEDLMKYYILSSFMFGPAFFIALIPLFFRYHTMRYRFDDNGISMRWGILFRREVNLTYARIQDIHLRSNFVERWLGLAKIQIQTASGSAGAEITIEGIKEYEALRNFLYSKMRGTKTASINKELSNQSSPVTANNELVSTLQDVARELRLLREELSKSEVNNA